MSSAIFLQVQIKGSYTNQRNGRSVGWTDEHKNPKLTEVNTEKNNNIITENE